MSYCVIDTEVTIRNRGDDAVGDMQASPYHPENEIVAIGWKEQGDEYRSIYASEYMGHIPSGKMLVFQNASFDAQWLMRANKERFLAWIRDGGRIYDTQIAEYLLTGQEHKFASLNELSAKYGGTQKDSRIEDYWNAGVDTDKIPKDELLEYLKNDVLNTEKVFLAQVDEAERLGMLPLLRIAMDDRLATILMEWSGMKFDTTVAEKNAFVLRSRIKNTHSQMCLYVNNSGTFCKHTEFNPSSPQHVSVGLFGGCLQYIADVPVFKDGIEVMYKTGAKAGLMKTKQTKLSECCDGFGVPIVPAWKLAKEGFFSTADENLQELLTEPKVSTEAKEFIALLLEYRRLSKDVSTYYEGYAKLTWPTDGCIHPSMNHAQTQTGRQSCSKPNLQNCSRQDT